MPFSILLVEDDYDLAQTIADYLGLEGILVDHAANGEAGYQLARRLVHDVLVLDLGLPRLDGVSLCQRLRKEGCETPILMLTARAGLNDKLAGFRAGTDDYLAKPFELAELEARLKVLSRRRSGESRRLVVDDLVMDLDRKEASRGKQKLRLTPTGWCLLELLMRKAPDLVSRRQMEEAVWGDTPPETDSLKVHLHKLRQEVDGKASFSMIQTVSGHGVRLRSKT